MTPPIWYLALLITASTSFAQVSDHGAAEFSTSVEELDTGEIVAFDSAGTYLYLSWDEYLRSSFFFRHGKRCGFNQLVHPPEVSFLGSQSDCSNSSSFPDAVYDPQGGTAPVYDVPVAFHVLYNNNGAGNIPDQRIFEQIQILNEDFAALTDAKIQFHLATVDPNGNATTGITRTQSRNYYNDRGDYASAVGWDTNRYLNIYSNTAGGNLGYAYVPNGGGVVGQSFDGVRLLWNSIGLTSYLPYNLGRTGTHEVGHYLGLFHTFDGGCGTSNCNASGDLCCDTNAESSPNYSACSPSERSTCGSPDPVRNYMDYSEDACMDNFSSEQAFRMRCTLENWRVDLTTWEGGGTGGTAPDQVTSPSPSNGSAGASTSSTLTWASANGATQYDVYFGTSSSPALQSSNQSSTSFSPGTLAASTTYFWRVDSENTTGVTMGPAWSFTTAADTGGGTIFTDGFENGTLSNWSTSGNARISTTSNSGAYAAELRRTSGITTVINNLLGASSVTVSWSWRTQGYETSDSVTATVTDGNGQSISVTQSGTTGYVPVQRTLNGVVAPITVQFSASANRNNERTYIDDVLVN